MQAGCLKEIDDAIGFKSDRGIGWLFVWTHLLFHNIPCSEVNDETCNNDEYWDRVCLTCEAYDWDRAYEWRAKTIKDGATIRGVTPIWSRMCL